LRELPHVVGTSSALQNGRAKENGPLRGRRAVPGNITGYVMKAMSQDSSWNLRNFGYFSGKATVSGRTVAESIEVVEFMNKEVLATALSFTGEVPNGPGKDCSAVDEDVYRCLRDGKDGCFAACKSAPTATSADRVVDRAAPGPVTDPANALEPCAPVNANAATSVTITKASSATIATLTGNDQQCLSRSIAGAFASTDGKLTIACSPTGPCTVSVTDTAADVDSVTLKGDEAQRFEKFLRTNGKGFVSRATGAGVSIACDSDCVVTVAADKASLPSVGEVVNPSR
jgi:hypothetical protein